MKFSHIATIVSASMPVVLAGNLRISSKYDVAVVKGKIVMKNPTPVDGFYICGGKPDDKNVQSVYVVKKLTDSVCYRDGTVHTSSFRAHETLGILKPDTNKLEVFSVAVQEGGKLAGPRVLVGGQKDNHGIGDVLIKTVANNPTGRFLPSIDKNLTPIPVYRDIDQKRKSLGGKNLLYRNKSYILLACPHATLKDKYIVKYGVRYTATVGPGCVQFFLQGDLDDCGNRGEENQHGCVKGRIERGSGGGDVVSDGIQVGNVIAKEESDDSDDVDDEVNMKTILASGKIIQTGGDLLDQQSESRIQPLSADLDEISAILPAEPNPKTLTKPKAMPPVQGSGTNNVGSGGRRGRNFRPAAGSTSGFVPSRPRVVDDEDEDIREILGEMNKVQDGNNFNLN